MKQKMKVLVVEDSLDDYLILEEVLKSSEKLEAELLQEDRLEGALAVAETCGIDVAIIDLTLPDSFGLETFLAFHERHPHIPTIIMSGAGDQDIAFEAVRRGAQDYLFKCELSSAAIVRSIRYAIERHRLTAELRRAHGQTDRLHEVLPIDRDTSPPAEV